MDLITTYYTQETITGDLHEDLIVCLSILLPEGGSVTCTHTWRYLYTYLVVMRCSGRKGGMEGVVDGSR